MVKVNVKKECFLDIAKSNKLIVIAAGLFLLIALPSLYIFEKNVRSDIYHSAQVDLKRELELKSLSLKNTSKIALTQLDF